MRYLLLSVLVVSGCSKAEKDTLPFRADALVGGGGGTGGEEPAPGDTRFLFFVLDDQGYVASAAGTGARPVCDAATLRVDDAGERVLCIPGDNAVPLQLYDVPANEVIASYAGWRESNQSTPVLSPDGTYVAYPTLSEQGSRVVQVRDDLENLVGEVRGASVFGFADSRTLLITSNGRKLWRIDEDPLRVPTNARPVGPDPAGAVFHERAGGTSASFLSAETGRTRVLGDGEVSSVRRRRVLVENMLYDVGDKNFAAEIPLPEVGFNQLVGARLVGSDRVVIEVRPVVATCEDASGAPIVSQLYKVRGDDLSTLYDDEGTPHTTQVDGRGRSVLVLDTDRCGVPQGTGRAGEIGDLTDLDDLLERPFTAAALSGDGRFVAVADELGVQVIDLSSDMLRPAAQGNATGELHFR